MNMHYYTMFFLSMIVALIGFFRFNYLTTQKVFMGHTGSVVSGFVLVCSAIILTQNSVSTPYFRQTFPLAINSLALPIFDSLRVYRSRNKTGQSPFKDHRTHIHQFIVQSGIKHRYSTLLISIF